MRACLGAVSLVRRTVLASEERMVLASSTHGQHELWAAGSEGQSQRCLWPHLSLEASPEPTGLELSLEEPGRGTTCS